MAEEIISQDHRATVTTARVIMHGTTYPLRNISSVRMATVSPNIAAPVLLIVFGALAVVGCAADYLDTHKLAWVVLLVGAWMTLLGILWVRSLRPWFHVVIASTGGEVNALSSQDRQYIARIVEAINVAIVSYR